MNQLALGYQQHVKARARLVGDRLELKNYKIANPLGTTPLTLTVGSDNGVAVLFRYGVVVFFGVSAGDETAFIDTLKNIITNAYDSPEVEELDIYSGKP